MSLKAEAVLLGGIPSENPALYHRVRFAVGDPAAWIGFGDTSSGYGNLESLFIVRDIEQQRAREQVKVDQVCCPADFTPASGLSGDRLTATAQSVAECLKKRSVSKVVTDRSLPFIYAWHIQQAGMEVLYDEDLGVLDRRIKDEQELVWLQESQAATEQAMTYACSMIAKADCNQAGELVVDGETLTSERVQQSIAVFLQELGYASSHGCIVASAPDSGDCHARGGGVLKTGQAVIVDIFPQSVSTHYWGDCTRTVVHGEPSDMILKMHAAVVDAKQAATAACVAGADAGSVHQTTVAKIVEHGFEFRRGEVSSDAPVMPHGTGHGIGLECHEPILLDDNGGTLLAGEVFTVEPGLYSTLHGGVRVEDMVVVQATGQPVNLNKLHEGLDWT